jgi:conjugal transfer pilus assembly protein TraU
MRFLQAWLMMVLSVAWSSASAQALPSSFSPSCPNAAVLSGGLFANICYACFFPIRVAGVPTGLNVPVGAASPICVCPSALFGIPEPGVTWGMWAPMRIIETVRMPFCSPTLGTNFGLGQSLTPRLVGDIGDKGEDQENESFYNFHVIAFPLGTVLRYLQASACSPGNSMDLDVLYASELDPTWNNPELSLLTTPEAALFATPDVIAGCAADAAAASTFQPLLPIYWCAGSWGQVFPYSGFSQFNGSPPREAATVATRALAALERRGLELLTMGDPAVCSAIPWPTLVKNQYKLEQIYPVPEIEFNHWIGATTFTWGEWRNIPAVGEDFVQTVWKWRDCCVQ